MNKKTLVVAVSLGLAQLALLETTALGQERPASQLDEVVLVASRSPKKKSEIGKVVRVISREEIARSQGRTLPELLNNQPGITISGSQTAPGANLSVYTRGGALGTTLILIDGIPASNASYINNDYDISSIAIDQVERIEILRGVNSTLYGSDAVAGVINIITKSPSRDALKAGLLATAGSYGAFKQATEVNGMLGKTGIALNFSNADADGFSAAKGAGFEKDGFRQRAMNAHLRQQFSDKFSVQANVQLNENKFNVDNGAFSDDPDYTTINSSFFGGINAKYQLPQGNIALIYNQNNVRNRFNDPDGATDFTRQDNKGKIYYTEAIINHKLTSFADLIAGVNYRAQETDQHIEGASSFGPFDVSLDYAAAHNYIISSYASVFLKADGFNLELGGRYNHHSQYGNNITYTVNPSYTFAGRYKVFAGVASAFKAPSLYQLNSSYKNVNGLDPEVTTSFEAGAELDLVPGDLNLSVSGFIRDMDHPIYFNTDPVTFASEYRNGDKQHDKGLEVELSSSPSDKVKLSAWYAYVQGEGIDVNGTPGNYLLRRPKNTWGASAGYTISSKAELNFTYKFTGDRLDPFGYPSVNLPQHAYSLLDAYLQIKPLTSFTFFADIKNLFDESYTEWEGYNTRGRNFNAGMKYSF